VIQKVYFWVCTYKSIKTGSGIDICTFVFIAALFTIAKTWKETSVYQQMDGEDE
jgi:hypothetical protein